MKIFKFTLISIALFIFSCTNELDDEEINLEVYYIEWACECANWVKIEDFNKYNNNLEKLNENCFFIEPKDESVILPDSLLKSGYYIKLKGKFYKKKGVPKGYKSFQNPRKAKVFNYSKYEIIIK
jgi:hypothetical protein